MSVANLIRARRTVQHFSSEKVSDEIVRQALELGHWAPNHKLTFPWRWNLVGPKTRAKIADLAIELKVKKSSEPVGEVTLTAIRNSVLIPSHYIALSIAKSADADRLWEDYASMACSVEIISLFLWENEIGSKWTTSGYSRNVKTYEILNIDPANELLVGGLLIGKAAKNPASQSRPPLDQFLRLHD